MTCCLNKNINSRPKNWVSLIKSVEIRQKRAVRPHYANLYAYAANNPVRYIDPDGRDVILLNRSWGAYLQGHNAVLIGNDKTGWTYYSKDDTHENNKIQFSSLDDFYKWNNSDKLKASLSYDKAYRVETTPEEDEVMKNTGDKFLNRPYSLKEKKESCRRSKLC